MLRTEADVIATLAGRAVTLDEIYAACERAKVVSRDSGETAIPGHGRDQVWRRRVRNRLTALKLRGMARRVGDAIWLIEGTREEPRRTIIIIDGEPGEIELVLAEATKFLGERDEPFDLIIADPPYGLSIGSEGDLVWERRRRLYASHRREGVVGGYVDVAGDYGEFTHDWVGAAAATVRELAPGHERAHDRAKGALAGCCRSVARSSRPVRAVRRSGVGLVAPGSRSYRSTKFFPRTGQHSPDRFMTRKSPAPACASPSSVSITQSQSSRTARTGKVLRKRPLPEAV